MEQGHDVLEDDDYNGEYAEDFTDLTDGSDLPLPGLHTHQLPVPWVAEDDWRLPGLLAQHSSGSDRSSSSGGSGGNTRNRDGDGRLGWDEHGVGSSSAGRVPLDAPTGPRGGAPSGMEAIAVRIGAAGASQDPWHYQGPSGALYSTGVEQPFAHSSTLSRRIPTPTLRSPAGTSLGGGSLRRRDSPRQAPPHSAQAPAGGGVATGAVRQSHAYAAATPPPPATPPPRQAQNSQYRLAPPEQQRQLLHPRSRRYDVLAVSGGSGGAMADAGTRAGIGVNGAAASTTAGGASGSRGGAGGPGNSSSDWALPEPFTRHTLASSCSTSPASSRDASPVPLSPVPLGSPLPGHRAGPPPWYENALFEQSLSRPGGLGMGMGMSMGTGLGSGMGSGLGLCLGIGAGMGLGLSGRLGGGNSGGLSAGMDAEMRPFGLMARHGMNAYSSGLGPASGFERRPDTAGSSRSSRRRSSDSSYTSDASWSPGASRFANAGRQDGGGHMLPSLWPAAGDSRPSPGGSVVGGAGGGMSGGGAASGGLMGRWRPPLVELPRPSDGLHAGGGLRGVGGSTMSRWRPPPLDESMDPFGGGLAGPRSTSPRGELSWEHRYGGAGGGSGFRLGGPGSGPAGGLGVPSPRGGLLGDGLGLLGRMGSGHMNLGRGEGLSGLGGGAALRPSLSGGLGGTLGRGRGEGSPAGGGAATSAAAAAASGGGGGLRIYTTTLDGPMGSYERRRIVLASPSRMQPQPLESPAAPAVRQYGDGLAGVLTNSQIQEWMSQHASRLLLPRHMQEIADIVFRPPSAVTEKRPPKCRAGSAPPTSLPPPVVLGGRYPPLHASRLLGDQAFVSSLLAGLPGVDPGNGHIHAVLTALQGKELLVAEEEDEEEAPPPPAPQQAVAAQS